MSHLPIPSLVPMEIVKGVDTGRETRTRAGDGVGSTPKVALFTDSDVFAGTERHILDLAEGLRELGVLVQIACPVPSPLAEMARGRKLTVMAIEKGGPIDLGAIRKLGALFRSGELDLVHAHNGRTALSSVLAAAWAGNGCSVFTQHFVEPGRMRCGRIQRFLKAVVHRFVNRRIDRFIAISAAVREAMLARADAPLERIATVPNGIPQPDIASFQNPAAMRAQFGIAENAPLVACVARLELEKDIPSLIGAMECLAVTNPELRCVIAGDGSQREVLERQVENSRLARNVIMAGFRPDAMAVINACDVFVLPSPAEPFGLVVLEAMALGKPVVAINNGGPVEIVVQDETGILVPASNPNALASAIRKLIESPNEAASMGRAGQRRMQERFSQSRMAREIMSAYESALLVAARKS